MVGPKAGPRRTKGLALGDTGTMTMQRKGDALANQDTCLSALRGSAIAIREKRLNVPYIPYSGRFLTDLNSCL